MKWQGRRGSSNIEDRRRMRGGTTGGIGIVGVLIVLAVGYFFGVDVTPLLQGGQGEQTTVQTVELTEADRAAGQFVSVTLADTEEIWADIFRQQLGRDYDPATLVLYKGVTRSPCGGASGATGPFYCPADKKAYLDTDFFVTMERRMGAGGDFAAAYVIAHEVAHHVQNELGLLQSMRQTREDGNRQSVRIELMADCFSGVWARQAGERFGSLERGDIEEAMNAAKQVGDDTIQRQSGQIPRPHTFTHGTSEQRMTWFAKGLQTGDVNACDTRQVPYAQL